jgi:two-component system CheB/CheR fusion protein
MRMKISLLADFKSASRLTPHASRLTPHASRLKSPQQKGMGTRSAKRPVPVVGIGASAGGLEAVTKLLNNLAADTGMAYVFVSHLPPNHVSHMAEILAKTTSMPVADARNGTVVLANHVYIMPPNVGISIAAGVLRLAERSMGGAGLKPIDAFFRSLAEDQKANAIGIVLSGSLSDGTLGLYAIKTGGGITFAQDEESAGHSGMPHNAIASGHVDFVLTPEEIARKLSTLGD